MLLKKETIAEIVCLFLQVIALDRTLSILKPMTSMTKQKQRTCLMLTGAWTLSLLSSLPAVSIRTLLFR